MAYYKSVCFLLILIAYSACSYGQVWKQFADSAKTYQEQERTEKAIEFYNKAREVLKIDSINTKTYATFCFTLAKLYVNTGKYEKAELLLLEVKQLQEKVVGMDHPDYAMSCNKLANLYTKMGQYEKAEPLYLEAKQIREKALSKDHPDYAQSCNNLAIFYNDMGQYEKSELLYQEAKQILKKALGKDHPEYAMSCNNMANLYMNMGQYEKAEQLYQEAKQVLEKVFGKEDPYYAGSCNNLAGLYTERRQYAKAEQLFLEAKQIREKMLGKEHPYYANSCDDLANLYMNMGQYAKAESLYQEAKQILGRVFGNKHPEYAQCCNNLANLYSMMGQYKKAESLYLEAKAIWEKVLGKGHPDYASSCNDLASLYWLLHEPLKAEKNFEESFSVDSYNLSSIFQFTNEKEKEAYIKNILGEDDKAYSFFASENIKSGQPYSLSLFHRNLILSSFQALKKEMFSTNDTTLSNNYTEWMNFKKYLAVLYAKPINERKEDMTKIEGKADQLEKELTRLSTAFAKQQQRIDWIDIQKKLQSDEASIEFASFHFHNGKQLTDTVLYIAIVLRKDRLLPATVFLFNEKKLQDLLFSTGYKTTKESVQKLYTSDGTALNNKAAKKSIYELIWKPLEKELKGTKTIYFSPSGLLHKIAFAALPINQKEVLSDRYKLVQLTTTASVADQQPSYITDSDKIQLYGGISYHVDTTALKDVAFAYHHEKTMSRSLPVDLTRSGEWMDLPGTKKEIQIIASFSGNNQTNITLHTGINATEESLKALDGKASPAVLHIATHGFFFPDPKQNIKNRKNDERGNVFKLSDDPLMRSGLLFAGANNAWQNKPVEGIDDGILTAYEVGNLYLPNTKLVVLSACETGLGDIQGNEGVYGLQRAFKMAGAQNLVMSLWKVSDLETAEFMEAFYKNMVAQQSISDAFYSAQNVMKNKYRLQPYKWAAWVLVR